MSAKILVSSQNLPFRVFPTHDFVGFGDSNPVNLEVISPSGGVKGYVSFPLYEAHHKTGLLEFLRNGLHGTENTPMSLPMSTLKGKKGIFL